MTSGLIPHRYAMALYKYAGENNQRKDVYGIMKTVAEAFRSNPDLEKVLSNPYVHTDDKRKLLLSAAGENPGDDYVRFVQLVLDHKREEFMYMMSLAYGDIYRTENNISQVKITTASELPDIELQKLRGVVEKSFKGETFEYSYAIDPDLIGGFVIDVDSTRMDASISNELEQLRQNLTSN
ncbi:MAG: F0F1 ATP synthase subunit delta [Candidatus Amulumruptor caecigallinarius]|nr:F0F1 ATP synthase subunit delta [Candidatus Amulumruptor caecigallinarius]